MPIIQDLSPKQIHDSLCEAVRRECPVALACRIDSMWHTLRSQILQLGDDGLHVAQPTGEGPVPELADALAASLSFKIKT